MGFQFWIPFFARSHFQLPNKMSIFKRRWILVKPSQFAFSIFPIFQTQMNIIIIWTIICMRILQPQTESGPRTYFFLFCSCFFRFFFPLNYIFHNVPLAKERSSFHHQSFPPLLQGGLRLLSDAAGDGGGPPAGLSQRSWDFLRLERLKLTLCSVCC